MDWGSDEPLPAWRIHFVAQARSYGFRLTDLRDPCSLSYSSDETGIIVEGNPIETGTRLVPLGTK
jgi:hypothetical protein